jgi:hypothetical protein
MRKSHLKESDHTGTVNRVMCPVQFWNCNCPSPLPAALNIECVYMVSDAKFPQYCTDTT